MSDDVKSNTNAKSKWIINKWADSIFIIGAPAFSLAAAIILLVLPTADEGQSPFSLNQPLGWLIITLTIGHLPLTFFRSHGNISVFKRFRWRLTIVPPLLFLGLYFNFWLAVIGGVLIIWWDVYHSSLQTFGLGRIYDQKAGNDTNLGRSWDWWLNLLLYFGPVLAGLNLLNHFALGLLNRNYLEPDQVETFQWVNALYQEDMAHGLANLMTALRLPLVLGFFIFLLAYGRFYRKQMANGYTFPTQKAILYGSTGFVSIFTWGLVHDSWTALNAFWVMNLFHAVQYFALVAHSEKKSFSQFLGFNKSSLGPIVAAIVILVGGFAAGAVIGGNSTKILIVFSVVCSLCHFWMDGFIWSVRKSHVTT